MRKDRQRQNILLLTTPFRPNIGGVETHLDDLIASGVERGWRFAVLTYQPLVTHARGEILEKGKGYTIFRIPWIRLNLFLRLEKYPILEFLYLFPPLFIVGFILFLLINSKIRKIHSQGLIAGAVGVILGRLFNRKVLLSTHSIYHFPKSGIYSQFVKFIFNNCEKILCLSNQSRQEVLSLGINPSKVEVFTYWIDQKIFRQHSKTECRKAIGQDLKKFICLFVGRLVKGKGVPELLEASRLLKRQIKFMIVGDGPLAALVRSAEVRQKNIEFVGKIPNNELPKYYNAADILLVPSTHEEGYGRVILEALSCGLPVVATNRGGVKEYITPDIGSLIDVTPNNIKNMILVLQNQPKKLKMMGAKAAHYARIRFNKGNCQIIFKNYE